MYNTWVGTLITAQGAGASLSSSASATSILPAQAKYTLPNNFWDHVGQEMRISGMCDVSNIVTTPGTLTLDIRFGGTVVFNGGAMQLSTTAHTTLPLWFEIYLTLRATGSSANLMGQGRATSQTLSLTAVADSTTTPATLLMPNTTPAVGTNFDATASQQVDMFATFSISNAANLIQLQTYRVESLN